MDLQSHYRRRKLPSPLTRTQQSSKNVTPEGSYDEAARSERKLEAAEAEGRKL